MLRIELDHDNPYSSNATVSNKTHISLPIISFDSLTSISTECSCFSHLKQICTYCPINIASILITVLMHVEHGNVNS